MADANDSTTKRAGEAPEMLTPEAIMRACTHDGPRESRLKTARGYVDACWHCGNAAGEAYRQQRKAQLAARPKDCQRCGRKPHTWNYGGYRLCGACKKLTEREHFAQAAKHGALAIFATSPLIDTSSWAARKEAAHA